MFNSTHTFVGLAAARAGLDRWAPRATLTAVIAANLPDIDIVADLFGMPSFIEHHRAITHSLAGIPLLSLALAAAMYVFTKSFWKTFLVALTAMATHPALDYANAYGLRPFLPFDGTWYYGDALFIFDPFVDGILLLGIIAGARFQQSRRIVAGLSILLVMAYIGGRVNLRNEAQSQLDRVTSRVAGFERSAVLPRMVNPWKWDGIVETRNEVFKVSVDTRAGVGPELARLSKAPGSKIIELASMAPSAAAFLGFARFPVIRVEENQAGYQITFADFRFYNETSRSAFAAEVQLDQSLRVIEDSLAFNKPIP